MAGTGERIIKPPQEPIYDGRSFSPIAALRYKKWLKFILSAFALWGVFLFSLYGPPLVTFFILEFIPINLWFVDVDWIVGSQVYWAFTILWLIPAIIWTHFYVKRIKYCVVGWEGERMPEIYQRKGIITVTEKHIPFRTVTNVQTRAGPFDRLFGIGSVKIDTAGESTGPPPSGVASLILTALFRNASEENIEGIVFYEKLEAFILRELRRFDFPLRLGRRVALKGRRKSIFTEATLNAFREIRQTLMESERK
jgi:membrane protein YdbS with pleckstrin-like domain